LSSPSIGFGSFSSGDDHEHPRPAEKSFGSSDRKDHCRPDAAERELGVRCDRISPNAGMGISTLSLISLCGAPAIPHPESRIPHLVYMSQIALFLFVIAVFTTAAVLLVRNFNK
jgi:hypothetical protein